MLGRLLLAALAGTALTGAFAAWYEAIEILVDPEFKSPIPSPVDAVPYVLSMVGFMVLAAALVAVVGITRAGRSWLWNAGISLLLGIIGVLVISFLYLIDWELPRDFGGRYLAYWVFAILVAIAIPIPLLLARRRPFWLVLPLGVLVIATGAVGDRLWFALELEYLWAPVYMLAAIGVVAGGLSAAALSIPLHTGGGLQQDRL